MKIGDVDITKIPPGKQVHCQNVGSEDGCSCNAIAYFNGVPYCADCLLAEQQKKWDNDGSFFENQDGERVHFEVIKKFLAE
jgi:hypothetical protein